MLALVALTAALFTVPGDAATPGSPEPEPARFDPVWRTRVPETFIGNASTSNGAWLVATARRVYVAGLELDAASGRRVRELLRAPDDPGLENVALDGGRVFLVGRFPWDRDTDVGGDPERARKLANDRALTVVDARTGNRLWRVRGHIDPILEVAAGSVFLILDDKLIALDAATGTLRWQGPEWISRGSEGIAAAGGVLAVEGSRIDEQATVRGLSAADGHQLWEARLPGTAYAGPAAGRDAFFVGRAVCPRESPETQCQMPGYTLSALDKASGRVRWQRTFALEESMSRAPAVSGGRVFVVTGSALHALSQQTGSELWSRAVVADDVSQDSRPVFAGDEVLIWTGDAAEHDRWGVSSTWHLLALDVATGALRWSWTPSSIPCETQGNGSDLSRPYLVENTVIYSDGYCVYRVKRLSGPGPKKR